MAGIAEALRRHRIVGLDTTVFIYHIEASSRYAMPAAAVFGGLANGAFVGVTSALTLMELVVKPLQMGRIDVADEYEVVVGNYPNLSVVDIDRPVARRAAELRARYRLRPADALQVAACLGHGAAAFVTNDRDLLRVREIEILLLEDFVDKGDNHGSPAR